MPGALKVSLSPGATMASYPGDAPHLRSMSAAPSSNGGHA